MQLLRRTVCLCATLRWVSWRVESASRGHCQHTRCRLSDGSGIINLLIFLCMPGCAISAGWCWVCEKYKEDFPVSYFPSCFFFILILIKINEILPSQATKKAVHPCTRLADRACHDQRLQRLPISSRKSETHCLFIHLFHQFAAKFVMNYEKR